MNKKGELISDRAGDTLIALYFFVSGLYTLNILGGSIAANASGIAFLIASVFGTVSIMKGTKFFA